MKSYPALDVRSSDTDLLYAALDDFAPTAIEERPDGLRAYFGDAATRDRAVRDLAERFAISPVDVPDEDWARRSQESLTPVTVERIRILPGVPSGPPASAAPDSVADAGSQTSLIVIVIEPSMGFGTGHHATTRLCLSAMQTIDLRGKRFLDIGTGSGILAIAAERLGARSTGVDSDADAIQSARENLAHNPSDSPVSFVLADLVRDPLPSSDVVAANLTGALLIRSAQVILGALRAGGLAILSGLMRDERDAVCRAFDGTTIEWERHEDEWVGLVAKKR